MNNNVSVKKLLTNFACHGDTAIATMTNEGRENASHLSVIIINKLFLERLYTIDYETFKVDQPISIVMIVPLKKPTIFITKGLKQ